MKERDLRGRGASGALCEAPHRAGPGEPPRSARRAVDLPVALWAWSVTLLWLVAHLTGFRRALALIGL